MAKPGRKSERLVGLFLLGCLLFNFPLLALFAGNARIWGIPLIYFYIFAAWIAIIALMALIIERKEQ